jgi:DNA-binding LytR/AlgR family response regulator
VFLDINMPVLDGLGFVKTLKEPPLIIFTTAYKEFAHEAFDVNACDYLLKPFSLERFIIAIEKAKEKLNGVPASQTSTETGASHFIYVKSEGKLFKVDFSNLCYAEAKGNNVKVVTDDGVIVITTTFSNFETQIPKSQFIRIHRSFIVNRSKIRLIEGNRVFIGDSEIPIGMNYREDFLKAIGVK